MHGSLLKYYLLPMEIIISENQPPKKFDFGGQIAMHFDFILAFTVPPYDHFISVCRRAIPLKFSCPILLVVQLHKAEKRTAFTALRSTTLRYET